MNDCNHEGSKENRMAIYNYPPAAAGFAQLQQQELDNCM
jgi:hypothetical protein